MSYSMRLPLLFLVLAALVLNACATPTRAEGLRVRLYNYAAAIRWNEITQASAYVSPNLQAEQPFTPDVQARWAQVQVSRYVEGPQSAAADGSVLQTVQIEIVDRSTQTVRTIIDRQVWRYDDTANIWWLESGLPQL